MILYPPLNTIEIMALVNRIEVCKWISDILDPVVGDHPQISIAHNHLPEHFEAVT